MIQANQQIAQAGLDLKSLITNGVQHAYYDIPKNWVFHGFLCGKALIEDAENNLFFCEMNFDATSKPIKIRFNEALCQESTSLPDKIVAMETYTKDDNALYALVLKQSGAIEFYYNGAKLLSSAKEKTVITLIGLTSNHIYLRTASDETLKLKFEGKKRLLFSHAKRCTRITDKNWNRILHERVKHERIELFFDFKMNANNLYVTFDRFTSSFDLLNSSAPPVTANLGAEAQYLLGVNKGGDTVGLFQEASDPAQALISQSTILNMNSEKGLTSKQNLPGRVLSKAEFNHFGEDGVQHASYFVAADEKGAE